MTIGLARLWMKCQRGATAVLCLAVSVFVSGCAPLTVYNALTPSDGGGDLYKTDVAYGALPRQKLDVYVPVNRAASAPVVVIIYGGGWNSGSKADYAFLGKALAARGFVSLVIDYRLVPEVRFPSFLEDCARAVVWAHGNAASFGGDPHRLFLLGHSAGAYNAVMMALDGRYLKALGSDTNIISGVAALAGPYDFLPLDVASTQEAFGRAPDLGMTQPINFAAKGAPPMFLATGDGDTTVFPRNTYALADRLKREGNSVTVETYPGVGHVEIMLALSVALRGKAPVLDDVTQFFKGH